MTCREARVELIGRWKTLQMSVRGRNGAIKERKHGTLGRLKNSCVCAIMSLFQQRGRVFSTVNSLIEL